MRAGQLVRLTVGMVGRAVSPAIDNYGFDELVPATTYFTRSASNGPPILRQSKLLGSTLTLLALQDASWPHHFAIHVVIVEQLWASQARATPRPTQRLLLPLQVFWGDSSAQVSAWPFPRRCYENFVTYPAICHC